MVTRRRGDAATRNNDLPLRLLRLHPSAFTLAESLFAMAIVSFTILSIIGMMPGGLSELRAAERRAAEARILQALSSEYQVTATDDLARISPSIRYFDVAGAELGSKTVDAVFAARAQAATNPKALKLPGEASPNPYVHHVRVLITERINDPAALEFTDGPHRGRREFTVVFTSMEPDNDDGIAP